MKPHRKVFIEWVDSRGTCDRVWVDMASHQPSDLDEIVCWTCGWLIAENEHVYCLALSVNAEQYGSCFEIPKVAVIRLDELEIKHG